MTVLEGATIVHHDSATQASLSFANGRVVVDGQDDHHRIDLHGHCIYPGLINAHDHLQLNCIPSLKHDTPFANSYAWISAFAAHRAIPVVAAAVAVPAEDRHWHGALKNILAGATTVAHHDPWNAALDDPTFPVELLRDAGWSHSLGLGGAREAVARYGPPVAASFASTLPDRPWVIHLAEGTDEVTAGELGELSALGCLSANSLLIHGVGLSATDIECVIRSGAAVVWCPASNMSMLGQTLDPHRLFGAGRLLLGTDSRLTGSRDLLEELRVAAACSNLSARELLRMVTGDACSVLRLHDRGALHLGCVADCVIVRAGDDAHSALLHATRSSLRAVIRNGYPVVADPDFRDWFVRSGVAAVEVRLDGCAKLLDARLAKRAAALPEPGLEMS